MGTLTANAARIFRKAHGERSDVAAAAALAEQESPAGFSVPASVSTSPAATVADGNEP
jgi:hypothetical protein